MRDLLPRLDQLRARQPSLFGSRGHQWRRTPATEAAVVAFEQRYGVRLPDEFRRFLLTVTDGGVGPGYGLFALQRSPGDDLAEDLSLLSRPFDPDEYFALAAPDYPEDDTDDALEARDAELEVYWRHLPGTMNLCHYGCAIRASLVVTGPLAGAVVVDVRSAEEGVHPFSAAAFGDLHRHGASSEDRRPLGFEAWYRHWIEANG